MKDHNQKADEALKAILNNQFYKDEIKKADNKTNVSSKESMEKREGISKEIKEDVEKEGRTNFFSHRKWWSRFILGWISLLIIFNIILTIFVGLGWFDFKNYQWFVTTVTTETFLQIVGLGFVAARYLFSGK